MKRAAKLSPNDPRIWNNLGLAQAQLGHFDDAYESFAKAQGEYKGHLNVAALLEQSGNTKKAIKHWEKAVALQPNSPEVLARLVILYHDKGDEKLAQDARSSMVKPALAQSTDKYAVWGMGRDMCRGGENPAADRRGGLTSGPATWMIIQAHRATREGSDLVGPRLDDWVRTTAIAGWTKTSMGSKMGVRFRRPELGGKQKWDT